MSRTTVPPSTRTTAAGLAAVALLLTGCGVDSPRVRVVVAERSPAPTAVVPTVVAPSPTATPTSPTATPAMPTAAPTGSASPSAVAPTPGASLTPSAPSAPPPTPPPASAPAVDVASVQRRLVELRYYAAEVDGRPGPALRSAVMAFQKVNGLTADGVVGPRTLAALDSPRSPVLRTSSPADRVEVDLDRQVLHVVEDGRVVRTMAVSSGNGESYRQEDGTRARALTPVGTYRIERRIVGVREADLGTLYDPQYFHRGWAIHGSESVPAWPASHGCVRVSRADARALLRLIDVGTTVHLHGGTHVFSAGSRAAGTSTPTGDATG